MATPAHVAIIMDGNGRWAKARGMPRLAGHRAGVEALRKTVRAAPGLGISFLTVYAFSSENWSRPKSEVSDLMGLLKLFIRRDLAELHQSGVRVRIIGDRAGLQPDIRGLLEEAESLTARNEALTLIIAFNYGGRDEIVRTARKLAAAVARGEIDSEAITAESFAGALDTAGIPDPELVIRTSGELRLSNFLLWQAAYSELVFLPCYWPDFSREHLADALRDFAGRERRFGGLAAQDVAAS
ncbi:isoprenyl transferase [Mesorhizobium caraganae]|jgi:undecaprenyl diphosphate synthase